MKIWWLSNVKRLAQYSNRVMICNLLFPLFLQLDYLFEQMWKNFVGLFCWFPATVHMFDLKCKFGSSTERLISIKYIEQCLTPHLRYKFLGFCITLSKSKMWRTFQSLLYFRVQSSKIQVQTKISRQMIGHRPEIVEMVNCLIYHKLKLI